MKYLLPLLMSSTCFATQYRFTFTTQDGEMLNSLSYKVNAPDRLKALEKAAEFCGSFYGIGKKKLTEEQAKDIIDACTNPRFN